jgi:hypothetical protein
MWCYNDTREDIVANQYSTKQIGAEIQLADIGTKL